MFGKKEIRPPVNELIRALETRFDDFSLSFAESTLTYVDKRTGFVFKYRPNTASMWCDNDYFSFSENEMYTVIDTIKMQKSIKQDQNRYKWTGVL